MSEAWNTSNIQGMPVLRNDVAILFCQIFLSQYLTSLPVFSQRYLRRHFGLAPAAKFKFIIFCVYNCYLWLSTLHFHKNWGSKN